jgi:hypothetical protein
MDMQNIEAGVRRALTAYKAEVGDDQATAAAWADQHLSDGVQLFVETLRNPSRDGLNDFTPGEEAFEKLKAWATTKL